MDLNKDFEEFFALLNKHKVRALKEFGFSFPELTVSELSKEGMVVQLGQPPNRIDLLNQITAGTFDAIWSHKIAGTYGQASVFFIHLDDLLKNKEAVARNKDKQDVEFFKKDT